MTLYARERLESRTKLGLGVGKIGGKRMFVVWDDAGASVTAEDAITTVAAGTTVPGETTFDGVVYGSIHPDDPSLIAIRIGETARVDGHRDLVELPWFYENVPPIPPGQPRQDEVGYVEQQANQRREQVKLYRVQSGNGFLLFPDEGNLGERGEPDNWWEKDILGVPNDIQGFRQSSLIYKVAGSITEIIEGSVNWPFLGSFASKRNSRVFFGGAVGKVVYAGPTSRSIGINKTAITHQFFYDEWFHLEQVADRDQEGKILLCGIGPGDPQPIVACKVYWRQPFPELADLHLLSDYFQGIPPGIGNVGRSIG